MFNQNRKVNINCFNLYSEYEPVIEESNSEYSILNWSSIQTKLIQLAGRLCNCYASDVIISINSIEQKMDKNELKDGDFFLFGFREMGVDHNSFVECHREGELNSTYREIWKMDVRNGILDTGYKGVQFKLYRVSYNSYANKNEE